MLIPLSLPFTPPLPAALADDAAAGIVTTGWYCVVVDSLSIVRSEERESSDLPVVHREARICILERVVQRVIRHSESGGQNKAIVAERGREDRGLFNIQLCQWSEP